MAFNNYTEPRINWASTDTTFDVVDQSGNPQTVPNKDQPPVDFQDVGQSPEDGFKANYYNYALDNLFKTVAQIQDNLDTVSLDVLRVQLAPAVGTIMSSDVDPATTYIGTTWNVVAQGRMLVGQDTGDTDFDTLAETGGSKTHNHDVSVIGYGTVEAGAPLTEPTDAGRLIVGSGQVEDSEQLESLNQALTAPDTSTESNVPPYYVTKFWKRVS